MRPIFPSEEEKDKIKSISILLLVAVKRSATLNEPVMETR
jgi:hypothetical protein